MLTENVIDQQKKKKVDLMAEIRSQVQETPAVDEVFQFGRAVSRSPVVLKDTNIEDNDIFKNQACMQSNQTYMQSNQSSMQSNQSFTQCNQSSMQSNQSFIQSNQSSMQ